MRALQELLKQFDLSKGAQRVVKRAEENDIDPSFYVERAVEVAQRNGKRKACVQRNGPLEELKHKVETVIYRS